MNPKYLRRAGLAAEQIAAKIPRIWADCFPHRISTPQGFINPIRYSEVIASMIYGFEEEDYAHITHQGMLVTALSLIKAGMPTFFLEEELCRALAHSDMPDVDFSEAHWPCDSLLLALPQRFSMEFFGHPVGFIAFSKTALGDHPSPSFVQRFKPRWEFLPASGVRMQFPGFSFHIKVCGDLSREDCEYSGLLRCNEPISSILGRSFLGSFETILPRIPEEKSEEIQREVVGPKTQEEDRMLQCSALSLGIKALLAMTSRPHLVEYGIQTRKEKISRKKRVDALWSPNIVGRSYRILNSQGEHSLNGQKLVREFRGRIGHFRFQAKGSRDKLVPIDTLPLTSEGSIDWINIPEETRKRFWESHEYLWIDPVSV